MKSWLVVALLLSVGINIGLLAGKAKSHRRGGPPAVVERIGDAPETERRTPDDHDQPDRTGPFVEKLADEVGVEGEARRQFVERQRAFFEQTREQRRQLRRQARQFRETMVAPQPDRELALRQLGEMSASQQGLEQAFVDNFFATRELLDPDQTVRFRRVILRLRHHRWERWTDGERQRSRDRRERDSRQGD